MTSLEAGYRIMAALQPLMGAPSSGAVLPEVTGASAVVPAGSFAVSAQGEERMVFVSRNPERGSQGDWTIAPGQTVPVETVGGGAHTESAPGTAFYWRLPIAGVGPAAVATGGISGGTSAVATGSLRRIRWYKEMSTPDAGRTFFSAQLGGGHAYPAALLQWLRSSPADGGSTPSRSTETRQGAAKRAFMHEWILYLISARMDGVDDRRVEGDILRDRVLAQLSDRQAFRGLALSDSSGIEIVEAALSRVLPTSYVDEVRFATRYTLERVDERGFNPWLRTRVQQRHPTGVDVPDYAIDMPHG